MPEPRKEAHAILSLFPLLALLCWPRECRKDEGHFQAGLMLSGSHQLGWGRTQTPLALYCTFHCYLGTPAGRITCYCPVCYLSSSRIQWECFQPELQRADRKNVGRVYTSPFVSLFLTSLCICNIRHMHRSAKELWEKQIQKVENTG